MRRTIILGVLPVLVLVCALSHVTKGDSYKSRNTAWTELKTGFDTLKSNTADVTKLDCTIDSSTFGMRCIGKYKNYDFVASLVIVPCAVPVMSELSVNIVAVPKDPMLDVNILRHQITKGEVYKLGDGKITTKDGLRSLQLSLQHEYHQMEKSLSLGITLEACPLTSKTDRSGCTIITELFKNKRFDLPTCYDGKIVGSDNVPGFAATSVGKPCTLGDLTSVCGTRELCQPASANSTSAFCTCLLGNSRAVMSGICEPDEVVPSAGTDGPSVLNSDDGDSAFTTVTVTLAVVIPLVLLSAIALLVAMGVKFNWVERLRQRSIHAQHYEEVRIGEVDSDVNTDDDDEPVIP